MTRLPLWVVLAHLGFCFSLNAQEIKAVEGAGNTILLVVPEADTVTTSSSTYRLSASTKPASSVSINNVSYKVYPSGAFCGKLDLAVGENVFIITSTHPTLGAAAKSFVILRTKPIETTRSDSLVIEGALMQPVQDMWLQEGDVLEVQCKGTPGCKATFMDGIEMTERPVSETGGIAGIYRGSSFMKATDTVRSRTVTFRLEDNGGRFVTRSTTAKILSRPDALPVVGVTKGERPFLNTGLGTDRLGGYKMGYVDSGVRLKITGKVGEMYRVALTENQEAWIDEAFVELQPAGTFVPSSVTGSMTVSPENSRDVVTLSLNDKLPYASSQLLDPSRIVVDVFGAVLNTNWITQQLSTKEIANVYATQSEKGVVRITIELRHKQVWGYEVGYEGKNLKIKVRRQPAKLKIKALTFGLDAGHGGDSRGAVGSTGALEKDVTLAIVRHLKSILEDKGARVILTRSDDSNVRMVDRFLNVYRGGADILISIHANSIGLTSNPSDSKGAGTFYKHICYRPLSEFILHAMLESGLDTLGNVGNFNFSLNAPTELPNVLVETAFLSNPEDEMKLLDDAFRERLARHIVDGVEEFLDYCDE